MLKANGQQPIGIQFLRLASHVLIANAYTLWASDLLGHVGHGDTALRMPGYFWRRPDDVWIAETPDPHAIVQIDHRQSSKHADMRCRYPNARSGAHGILKILRQRCQSGIKIGHVLRRQSQARIGELKQG